MHDVVQSYYKNGWSEDYYCKLHDAIVNAVWCAKFKITLQNFLLTLITSFCAKRTSTSEFDLLMRIRDLLQLSAFEEFLDKSTSKFYEQIYSEFLDNNMNDPTVMIKMLYISDKPMSVINDITARHIKKYHPIYERERIINLYFNRIKGKLAKIYKAHYQEYGILTYQLMIIHALNAARHIIFGQYGKVKDADGYMKVIERGADMLAEMFEISLTNDDVQPTDTITRMLSMDSDEIAKYVESKVQF
jgi:hypothetical protein